MAGKTWLVNEPLTPSLTFIYIQSVVEQELIDYNDINFTNKRMEQLGRLT